MYVCMCVCIVKILEKIILLYVTLILSRTHTHIKLYLNIEYEIENEKCSVLCVCVCVYVWASCVYDRPAGLFLYYISIYSEFSIRKKFVKKKKKTERYIEARTRDAQNSSLSPCLLDYACWLRVCFTNHVIQNSRNFKQWFLANYWQ